MNNWKTLKEYKEILFQQYQGIARISINRPHVHNAFTPLTVQEMIDALSICREETSIGVVVLTGEGGQAFCSGGDQKVRGHGGYVGADSVPRLNILDFQKMIRSLPKPVIAAVA
ncbi:MAG: 1,4-dihydroxy-2-naphthoyl-CoA synthase, partial [Candidatus Nephrothrix sp. EaCA]